MVVRDTGEVEDDGGHVQQQRSYSEVDPSTKLLILAKKGEWQLIDNILRYTNKNSLDLTLVDEVVFFYALMSRYLVL